MDAAAIPDIRVSAADDDGEAQSPQSPGPSSQILADFRGAAGQDTPSRTQSGPALAASSSNARNINMQRTPQPRFQIALGNSTCSDEEDMLANTPSRANLILGAAGGMGNLERLAMPVRLVEPGSGDVDSFGPAGPGARLGRPNGMQMQVSGGQSMMGSEGGYRLDISPRPSTMRGGGESQRPSQYDGDPAGRENSLDTNRQQEGEPQRRRQSRKATDKSWQKEPVDMNPPEFRHELLLLIKARQDALRRQMEAQHKALLSAVEHHLLVKEGVQLPVEAVVSMMHDRNLLPGEYVARASQRNNGSLNLGGLNMQPQPTEFTTPENTALVPMPSAVSGATSSFMPATRTSRSDNTGATHRPSLHAQQTRSSGPLVAGRGSSARFSPASSCSGLVQREGAGLRGGSLGDEELAGLNETIVQTNEITGEIEDTVVKENNLAYMRRFSMEYMNAFHVVPEGIEAAVRSMQFANSRTMSKAVEFLLGDGDKVIGDGFFNDKSVIEMPVLDTIILVTLLVNTIVLVVEFQWEGYRSAKILGIQTEDGGWPQAETVILVLEYVFVSIYVMEVIIRFCVYRCKYFTQAMNCFDTALVAAACLELYVFRNLARDPLEDSQADLTMFRFFRLLKAVRTLRVIRTVRLFQDLRVLVRTIFACTRSLVTAMTLLALMMLMSGILMVQFLKEFIRNEDNPYELRLWVWTYYGTAIRAAYTFFEVTLSGCWPSYVRPLMDNISPWYGAFFAFYIALVGFAVTRIMTAMFLKETMDIANNDAEMVASEELRKKEIRLTQLRSFFREADQSGDGTLSYQELEEIMQNPKVKSWLQVLGLEVHETNLLFHLLDDGDGEVTVDEFIKGIGRLKGQSRAIDVVTIQREIELLQEEMENLRMGFADVYGHSYFPAWNPNKRKVGGVRGISAGARRRKERKATERSLKQAYSNSTNGTARGSMPSSPFSGRFNKKGSFF